MTTTSLLLKLGNYKFSVNTAAFSQLERKYSYNWTASDQGDGPSLTYGGLGAQTITLPGVIYPGQFGATADQVEKIAAMAAQGEPLRMVPTTGKKMGFWVIKSISETRKTLMPNGAPRKIEFSIELEYYGPKYPSRKK